MCDKKKVAKHVKHDARSFFFYFFELQTFHLNKFTSFCILYFFFGFF